MTASGGRDEPTVLVVDDEAAFAESAALWLEDDYDVRVATDGNEAVETYTGEVDAVLMDRRMPEMTGDEALEEIAEQAGRTGVAVMSAVEPDFDILEMEFDEYLRKPVRKQDVLETTEKLVRRAHYPEELREIFALAATIEALGERYSRQQLEADDRHQELVDELASRAAVVSADLSVLHDEDATRFENDFDETLRHR